MAALSNPLRWLSAFWREGRKQYGEFEGGPSKPTLKAWLFFAVLWAPCVVPGFYVGRMASPLFVGLPTGAVAVLWACVYLASFAVRPKELSVALGGVWCGVLIALLEGREPIAWLSLVSFALPDGWLLVALLLAVGVLLVKLFRRPDVTPRSILYDALNDKPPEARFIQPGELEEMGLVDER